MSGFNIDDRVVVTECGWTLQDGTEPPAYGRIDDVFLDGTCYVEFDMGAQGRLTLPIPVGFLAHDPSIPTLAENVARVRAERAAKIAAAGYSLPEPRIVAQPNVNHRPVEMTLPADGQANTAGIKRDFEAGGLGGILDNLKPMLQAMQDRPPSVATVLEGIARWQMANAGKWVDSLVREDGSVNANIDAGRVAYSRTIKFLKPLPAHQVRQAIDHLMQGRLGQ